MKVLHVNKFLYRRGGAEAYLLDVAQMQRERGDEVALFGMQHPDNPPLPYEAHFPSNVEFEPEPADARERIRVAARMLWSTSARRGIRAVIEDFRPDVVHFHNIYHHLSPSVVSATHRAGVPSVMTLHDYKLACPSYLFLANGELCEDCIGGHFSHAVRRRCKDGSLAASTLLAVESTVHAKTRAYGGIAAFIAPSRFMAAKMREAGVYPDRLHVVPNPVDIPAEPAPRDRSGGLLYASRLSPEKGVDVLVRAMGELPDGLMLDVVGDGPQRRELEDLADRVAPGRIRFHGRVDRGRVTSFMRDTVAVVAPSRCYENQPLMVLEAFALGVPVVGSRLGGIAEIVVEGETGSLAPHDDPAALAAAILRVTDDRTAAAAMGERARAFVSSHHGRDTHLRALDAVYDAAARAQDRGAVPDQVAG